MKIMIQQLLIFIIILNTHIFVCNNVKNPGLLPGFWGGVMLIGSTSSLIIFVFTFSLREDEKKPVFAILSFFFLFAIPQRVGPFVELLTFLYTDTVKIFLTENLVSMISQQEIVKE